MTVDKSAWIKACFIIITFVVSPFSKLVFHLWLTQPPQFQFLSQFYFPPDLLEHHIHQDKTMLIHYFFTWDYFHILDTTSILVIHKKVINHCFSFRIWMLWGDFSFFWKQVFIKRSPFYQLPVQKSDPSIIYLPNPKIPTNFSKTSHITTNMAINIRLFSCRQAL